MIKDRRVTWAPSAIRKTLSGDLSPKSPFMLRRLPPFSELKNVSSSVELDCGKPSVAFEVSMIDIQTKPPVVKKAPSISIIAEEEDESDAAVQECATESVNTSIISDKLESNCRRSSEEDFESVEEDAAPPDGRRRSVQFAEVHDSMTFTPDAAPATASLLQTPEGSKAKARSRSLSTPYLVCMLLLLVCTLKKLWVTVGMLKVKQSVKIRDVIGEKVLLTLNDALNEEDRESLVSDLEFAIMEFFVSKCGDTSFAALVNDSFSVSCNDEAAFSVTRKSLFSHSDKDAECYDKEHSDVSLLLFRTRNLFLSAIAAMSVI